MKVTMFVALLLLVASAAWHTTKAQNIIFPGSSVPGVCRLSGGETGRCVAFRQCRHAMRTFRHTPPKHCYFEGDNPIVCCPLPEKKYTLTLTDSPFPALTLRGVAPPVVDFECGVQGTKPFMIPHGSTSGVVLRPDNNNNSNEAGRGKREAEPKTMATPTIRGDLLPPPPTLDIPLQAVPSTEDHSSETYLLVHALPATINAWPWMALIGEREADGRLSWYCAGALVSDQWVLSALHCFLHRSADVVRLGEYDYNSVDDNSTPQDFGVEEVVLYPDYVHPQAYHDLALLKLQKKVIFQNDISPVCLPWGEEGNRILNGSTLTLAGWGNTASGGVPSSRLLQVDVTVYETALCDQRYRQLPIFSSRWPQGMGVETICAGDMQRGRDACQGDSGGPAVYQGPGGRYTLAGVISQGYGCGKTEYPGLYVNLRHQPYLAWIKTVAFQP